MSMSPLRSIRAAAADDQRGGFLLEALISVLIVALGILGLVGLFARSVQNVDESKFRAEAALLANSLIGQMWIADRATMVNNFDSSMGGAAYTEFKTVLNQRIPGSTVADPIVTITPGPAPNSFDVVITVFWQTPSTGVQHQHWASGTIGRNN